MKNLFLISILILSLSGCKKAPGNLEITVSYFYNNFLGYKPDVGANAILFEEKYLSGICKDSINLINSRVGVFYNTKGKAIDDPKNMLKAEANVEGKITFKDIPCGKYFLLVISNGRYVFSKKVIDIESAKTLSLVKNFEATHDMDTNGESWN